MVLFGQIMSTTVDILIFSCIINKNLVVLVTKFGI